MTPPSKLTVKERLLLRVVCDVETRCWNFVGGCRNKGYGILTIAPNTEDKAHRVAYREFVGPIPKGIHLHHVCENRACCNPEHLQPVTPAQHNQLSERNLVRIAAAKTACPRGHPLVEGNLVASRKRDGIRLCLTCKREAAKALYYRQRQKVLDKQKARKMRDPVKFNAAQARYQAAYKARLRERCA